MQFVAAIELGLMYALMAVGVYISFRILDIADLSVDGTFPLGAAVSILMTVNGMPYLGLLLALLAGAAAGCVTAFLQTKLKVQPILAGILTMTALYSINLHIMGGRPNVAALGDDTIFTPFETLFGSDFGRFPILLLILGGMVLLLILFLRTQLGLSLRATGDNEAMVRASSINADAMKFIGLAIANGFVALSGAMVGQYQKSFDVSMGIGMVVIALASVIIGETLMRRRSVAYNLITAIVGAIVYRLIMMLVIELGLPTTDMKLLGALIIAVAISIPVIKKKLSGRGKRHA